jgi:arginase
MEDRHGIGKIMDMALGWIGSDTPIHLSFDIDALDPIYAPSTGTDRITDRAGSR